MTDLRSLEAKIAALQLRMDSFMTMHTPVAVNTVRGNTAITVDASFHTITDLDTGVSDQNEYLLDVGLFYSPNGSVGNPVFKIAVTSTGFSRLFFMAYVQGIADVDNVYRPGDVNGGFTACANQNAVGSFAVIRGYFKASGDQTLHVQASCGAGNSQITVDDNSYISLLLAR